MLATRSFNPSSVRPLLDVAARVWRTDAGRPLFHLEVLDFARKGAPGSLLLALSLDEAAELSGRLTELLHDHAASDPRWITKGNRKVGTATFVEGA